MTRRLPNGQYEVKAPTGKLLAITDTAREAAYIEDREAALELAIEKYDRPYREDA